MSLYILISIFSPFYFSFCCSFFTVVSFFIIIIIIIIMIFFVVVVIVVVVVSVWVDNVLFLSLAGFLGPRWRLGYRRLVISTIVYAHWSFNAILLDGTRSWCCKCER